MRFFSGSLVLAGVLVVSGLPVSAAPPAEVSSERMQRAPIEAIVTSGDAYLPGAVQMVSPARVRQVILHPQGRYALIIQNEVAPPPGASMGKPETGAIALLLYDAHLNKTRTLWERRANDMEGAENNIDAQWLAGTDCAVAVTQSVVPPAGNMLNSGRTSTLVFFNIEKSLSGRTLLTSPNALRLSSSPTGPLYLVEETIESGPNQQSGKRVRMGNARGTLGPLLEMSRTTFFARWGADANTAYAAEFVRETPITPNEKTRLTLRWHEWTGQAATMTPLSGEPTKAQIAQAIIPPALPFAAQTLSLPIPKNAKANPTPVTLHPLYLEATDTDAAMHLNRALLIAPDADKSYLLSDKSAVLYESKGALYAVPLVHLKSAALAQAQKEADKQAAMKNAKRIGMGILMYAETHDDALPPPVGLSTLLAPYAGGAHALNGFTYAFAPGGRLAAMASPATTTLGYIAGPGGGRALVYADGHVAWEDGQ